MDTCQAPHRKVKTPHLMRTTELRLQLRDLMALALQVCLQLGCLKAPLTELAVGTIALIIGRCLLHLLLPQLSSHRLSLLMGGSCLQQELSAWNMVLCTAARGARPGSTCLPLVSAHQACRS